MQIATNESISSEISKAHSERLSCINDANCLFGFKAGLNYFAMTLAALRDSMILNDPCPTSENMRLVTIIAAIEEYKKYADCENKFFYQDGDEIKTRGNDEDAVFDEYLKEKQLHLGTFCDIVKKNLLSWEANYVELQ